MKTTAPKRLINRLFPKPVIVAGWQAVTSLLVMAYARKFNPLLIRKGTSDKEVFRDIFLFGDLSLPIKIQPRSIVDAGAYAGFSTLYYTLKYPGAKIVSIEPESSNFEQLRQHTQSLENVSILKAGLWHKNAFLKINDRATGKWGFTVEEVPEGEDYHIKAVTIDHIMNTHNLTTIDLLKLDIEGAEKEVFTDNYQSWINRVNVIAIELHDRIKPGCTDALYSAINQDVWHHYETNEKVVLVRKEMIEN